MKKLPILMLLFFAGFSLAGAQGLVRYVWLPSWDVNIPGTSSNYGDMPLTAIRWNSGTHFSMFAVPMNSTGSAITWNNLLVDRRKPLNDKAHAAGKPIYLCLGGSESDGWMTSAFSAANRSTAIATLISTMETYQYDGFDFDWEPFSKADTAIFYPFVRQLYAALQSKHAYYDVTKKPEIILTMSPGGSQWGSTLKPIEPYLKFVVLMAYDKMGTWTEVTYYDCAVTGRDANGTIVQKVAGQEPATVERQAAQTTGFNPKKIVVGIDMMGAVTPGNTAPFQTQTNGGAINADYKFDTFYKDVLMSSPRPTIQYDAVAGAYWCTKNGNFYSFMGAPGHDAAMGKAFALLQAKGYGGIAIWDMTEAYLGTGKFPAASYPGLDRDWVGTQLLKWSGTTVAPPPPGDALPPTVSLTAPAPGATVSGTIQVSVSASDASGIGSVRLMVDGVLTGTADQSSPYSFSWNSTTVGDGSHTLGAEATDGSGLKTTTGIQVTVRNAVAPPPDALPPTVSLTAPAPGATLTGTVQISVNATDASGISSVRLKVDGVLTGTADLSAPYSFSWNSASIGDGAHTLGAEATDGAGLKTTAGVQVVVSNGGITPPPPPGGGGTVAIYDDKLASPWINASWGATNVYNSSERAFDGSASIKSVQNAWGSLSTRSGTWWNPAPVDMSAYDSVKFAVYPEETGLRIAVWFDVDGGAELPKVTRSNIPAGRWTVISIPVSELNADGQVVNQLNIQNYTSAIRTYHVDGLHFSLAGSSKMQAGTTLSGAVTESETLPEFYSLAQNFPNPFNPTTTIGFALPQASMVTIRVYDIAGREVRALLGGELGAGVSSVQWDGRNEAGATLSSGAYFYRIEAVSMENPADVFVQTKRMMLLK